MKLSSAHTNILVTAAAGVDVVYSCGLRQTHTIEHLQYSVLLPDTRTYISQARVPWRMTSFIFGASKVKKALRPIAIYRCWWNPNGPVCLFVGLFVCYVWYIMYVWCLCEMEWKWALWVWLTCSHKTDKVLTSMRVEEKRVSLCVCPLAITLFSDF